MLFLIFKNGNRILNNLLQFTPNKGFLWVV
jgi:hypothetical protein